MFLRLALFLWAMPVFAGSLDVVQSVPVETTLEVPGIPQTQSVWVQMIASAQKSIDLEQFYIHHQSGESLEPVIQALTEASKRGVKIRFIIDIQFFKNYPDVPKQLNQIPNISVKTISFAATGGIQHAKFFMIDGKDVFLGSANFDWLAISHIHEVGLRIQDESLAKSLASIFEMDWSKASSMSNSYASDVNPQVIKGGGKNASSTLKLVASPNALLPAGVTSSLDSIVKLIGSSKKSVYIQVYQYSTKGKNGGWKVLDDAIRAAAARGVDVKLLVDSVALKNSSVELSSLAKVQNVQVRTIKIPQWSGGPLKYARLIHSKYMIVDGVSSWVGTENWSQNYFTGCRNVGVIVNSIDTATKLDQIYRQVWNSPYASSL